MTSNTIPTITIPNETYSDPTDPCAARAKSINELYTLLVDNKEINQTALATLVLKANGLLPEEFLWKLTKNKHQPALSRFPGIEQLDGSPESLKVLRDGLDKWNKEVEKSYASGDNYVTGQAYEVKGTFPDAKRYCVITWGFRDEGRALWFVETSEGCVLYHQMRFRNTNVEDLAKDMLDIAGTDVVTYYLNWDACMQVVKGQPSIAQRFFGNGIAALPGEISITSKKNIVKMLNVKVGYW